MTDICYDIQDAVFSYDRAPVINGITVQFPKGKFYGVLGPNGCGKTTFLDLLSGHSQPSSGDILFMGNAFGKIPKKMLSTKIALVSQNFYINFPYTVKDVVMMGRYPHMPRFSAPSCEDIEICDRAMETTGVKQFENHMVTELSGGERQRTVFARALAQSTDMLLLDEATSNLDVSHSIFLLDTVKKNVVENGMTVISVFQDINLAAVFCDELVFMNRGRIIRKGPTDQLMDASLLKEVFDVDAKLRFEPLYQAKQAVFKTGREVPWS